MFCAVVGLDAPDADAAAPLVLGLGQGERLTTTERYGTSNRGCENRTTVRFNGESAHSDKV